MLRVVRSGTSLSPSRPCPWLETYSWDAYAAEAVLRGGTPSTAVVKYPASSTEMQPPKSGTVSFSVVVRFRNGEVGGWENDVMCLVSYAEQLHTPLARDARATP